MLHLRDVYVLVNGYGYNLHVLFIYVWPMWIRGGGVVRLLSTKCG